ncbi:MAG: metallophosphoesterase family protein [Marinilabiliaceae bacterium]|nr:metallophosphoesterase family protein [Marinilabiliaceae bacterium]
MKRYIVLAPLLLLFTFGLSGEEKSLTFNSDGSFKIIQFTDTHFHYGSYKSEVVLEMMNEVLDIEQPDLVIFTGDIVTLAPLKDGWVKITESLVKRQIHWAVTIGNHDDEQDKKRDEILPLIKDIPFNVTQVGAEDVYGQGNYVLPILNKAGKKTSALLYCVDSNAYTPIEGIGDYGWFHLSQIDWYRQVSTEFTRKNDGKPLPALAFFHIPLPEYKDAWEMKDKRLVGVKNEAVCSPVFNSGMFAAMLHQGDVMGTFVGHDHDNDYLAPYCGIALAYGRFSGGATIYGDLTNGARVILLKEGKRRFTSWLRIRGGEKINTVKFNAK